MKTLIFLIIFLALVPAFGQSPSGVDALKAKAKFQKLKDLIIGYDKFKDQTMIATKPHNLIGSWEGGMGIVVGSPQIALAVYVLSVFKGSNLAEPPERYSLLFVSLGNRWNYIKGDNTLYLIVDGERQELEPDAKDSEIMRSAFDGKVTTGETLGFIITRAELEKLANAKEIELRLGNTKPRKFKPEFLERIRAILALTTN